MRSLTLSKRQFDLMVFPMVASVPADNESELETGVRLLRKFRDLKVTEPEAPGPDAQEAMKAGQAWYPNHKLKGPEHTFLLEEDEHRLVLKRMQASIPRVSPLAAEDFLFVLGEIRDAPDYKPVKIEGPPKE